MASDSKGFGAISFERRFAIVLTFIEPMQPTLSPTVPEGAGWIHEVKHDGYRTQLAIDGGEARAFTRNGHDWSHRYQGFIRAGLDLRCSSAVIDGEAIVQDEQGRSDFAAFAQALIDRPQDLVFMAFDLMHLDGLDLRREPVIDRRARLRDLIGCADPACRLQFSEHMTGNGADFFEAVDAMGLEGIVSKKATSRYRSGRVKTWLKVKCFDEADFIVIGVEAARGSPPTAFLARREADGLSYAGSAFIALSGAQRDRFWAIVDRTQVERPSVAMKKRGARWVEPTMLVRVRFLKGSDKLRHATVREIL